MRRDEQTVAMAPLWRQFKERGCLKARDALIHYYSPLVAKVRNGCVRHVHSSVDKDDLESEGFIALVVAIDRFDPRNDGGAAFESYVWLCIRGAMLDYLRREDWAPEGVRSAQKEWQKLQDDYRYATGNSNPTIAQLAKFSGRSYEALESLYHEACVPEVVSLESELYDKNNEGGQLLGDRLASPPVEFCGPDEDVDEQVLTLQKVQNELIEHMVRLARISPRHFEVMVLYYGEGRTLENVGTLLPSSTRKNLDGTPKQGVAKTTVWRLYKEARCALVTSLQWREEVVHAVLVTLKGKAELLWQRAHDAVGNVLPVGAATGLWSYFTQKRTRPNKVREKERPPELIDDGASELWRSFMRKPSRRNEDALVRWYWAVVEAQRDVILATHPRMSTRALELRGEEELRRMIRLVTTAREQRDFSVLATPCVAVVLQEMLMPSSARC